MNQDFDQVRTWKRAIERDCDFDSAYMFFYDESNNHRKFVVRPTSFNVDHEGNFILGGLVFTGSAPPVHELRQRLALQASVKEIKMRNLANGDFLQCLQAPRVATFLSFLLQHEVYVHIKSVNYLYFVLVDVVDSLISALPEADALRYVMYERPLKSALYDVALQELPRVIDLLHRYEVPNIAPADVQPFLQAWQALVAPYAAAPTAEPAVSMLGRLLAHGLRVTELPFMQDGKSHVLLDSLIGFYMNNIFLFANSTHVFDREQSLEPMLAAALDGVPGRYFFEDSTQSLLIQACDVVAGLMAKFTHFVNTTPQAQLPRAIEGLTPVQRNTLNLLLDVLVKSEQHNRCFLHFSASISEMNKVQQLLAMAPLRQRAANAK